MNLARWLSLLLLVGCWSTPDPVASEKSAGEKTGENRKNHKKGKEEVELVAMNDALAAAPNILVIVWDTVRADRMSAYGYNKPTTPKVEAWAKGAVRYDRAVSPGVWTLPSHASLFTGLSERGHGVNADHNWLDSDHLTVAEALTGAGYNTWTWTSNPYLAEDTNMLQGFQKKDYPWRPKWRDEVDAHMKSKLIAQDASTPVSPATEESKGGAGSNRYLFKESGPVASKALFDYLDNRADKDRPFFAFINYMEAHLPRIPRLASRQAVMSEAEITRSYKLAQSTTDFHEYMVGVRKYDALDLAAISGVYDASLIDMDEATGALLAELDRRGLAEDTIVILTSDHGENLGDHELLLHKYAVYDTLVRVPLIVAWKGHLTPGVESAPKSVSDAVLDAIRLAKAPLTPEDQAVFDSRPKTAQGVVAEFTAVADGSVDRMKKLHPQSNTARLENRYEAIVGGSWKYIEGSDGSKQLYDLASDPGELTNRATTDAAQAADLGAQLKAWMEAVPVYRPTGEGSGHKRSEDEKEGLEALGYVQ